jgi:hypothetical protein
MSCSGSTFEIMNRGVGRRRGMERVSRAFKWTGTVHDVLYFSFSGDLTNKTFARMNWILKFKDRQREERPDIDRCIRIFQ